MKWNDLTMSQRSELMKLYLKHGTTSLDAMREHYNNFAGGGKIPFKVWRNKMKSKYPDLEMDNDKAGYDYESYFNNNYEDAIKQLTNLQHFPDTYKLPNHPTFSNESIYSRGPVMGGSWGYDYTKGILGGETFTPSVINKQYHPDIYTDDLPYNPDYISEKYQQMQRVIGYIGRVENPDSLGWDPATRRWYAPPSGVGDPNQRGLGVDMNTNPYVTDANRKNGYLTEVEERSIREKFIRGDVTTSYNNRLSYAKKKYPDWDGNVSDRKRELIYQAIYQSPGTFARNFDGDLLGSFVNGSDEEFEQQIKRYHERSFPKNNIGKNRISLIKNASK